MTESWGPVTNVVAFDTRVSIERQAREWLIRLDGDDPLTSTEAAALREWMTRSPSHREELLRIAKVWRQANVLTELAAGLGTGILGRPRYRMRLPLAVAGTVLASVVFVWWFLLQRTSGVTNGTYGTAIGQQQTIVLLDGSSVQLNTDTQVHVIYSERLRRIRLLRGEALFSVKPDAHRVFEVHAADSVVRAVGTAFAVHLNGSKVDITVTKGVVDIDELHRAPAAENAEQGGAASTSRLARLKAGQTTTFANGINPLEIHQLADPDLQRRMAWHDGYLVFSGEPLSEVVEQMNRYSPVTLEITDPSLRSISFGGRFRIGDLDAVLDALHTNFGIQSYQVDERNIRLESARPR